MISQNTKSTLITVVVIFAFIGAILLSIMCQGCATLSSITTPKYGELVMDYPDGDTITYVLPAEFIELDQEELEIFPVSMFVWVVRQSTDDNIYGIFLWAPEAIGLGCAIMPQSSDIPEDGQYWLYDAEGIPQSCTYDQLNAFCMMWDTPEGLFPIEEEPEVIPL